MQYKSAPHLKAKFGDLPIEIRQSMSSLDSITIIEKIGKKYALHIDQIGELADETWLVMLGVTKTGDFIAQLASRLKIDRNKAGQIAADINSELFLKIRESLKKMQEEQEARAAVPPEESPAPAKKEPLPGKSDILSGIENPEMAGLSGDSVRKTGMGLTEEQADILKGIENPPAAPVREYTPPAAQAPKAPVAPAPSAPTQQAEPATERVVPITKISPAPVKTPDVYPAEPGGPLGEGRLPTTDVKRPIVEQKTTATFRMPPKKTQVQAPIAPRTTGGDPYREIPK